MKFLTVILLIIFVGFGNSETFDVGLSLDDFHPLGGQNGEASNDIFIRDQGSGTLPVDSYDNSTGLLEFTPIRDTILQSQTHYFSFGVNTTTGVGEFYEFLIFITGNICSQPTNVQANETSLAVYYSFNSSMFGNFELGSMTLYQNGYFQALTDVPSGNSTKDSILYIAVRAPENTNRTAEWSYQIGVSQNDLVFQWDDRSWAQVVDTDENSALIVTGNLTSSLDQDWNELNATESRYSLYVYSYENRDYFSALNESWCAVRNGPALMTLEDFDSSYTIRNGGLQQQFYIKGLNESTKYIAYLLSDFQGSDFGGALYQPFEFETLDKPACELIFDLPFCDQVAYSVPSNSKDTKEDVSALYDNQAKELYGNFSKALQQIACNTTEDSIFSPVRTCEDCAASYKNWLCAVTIPRCSTRNLTGYVYRDLNESRNSFINDMVLPDFSYFEILPCLNVCDAIVRDCPADFGFLCPTKNLTNSYLKGSADIDGFPTCNYVGKYKATSGVLSMYMVNWYLLAALVAISVTI